MMFILAVRLWISLTKERDTRRRVPPRQRHAASAPFLGPWSSAFAAMRLAGRPRGPVGQNACDDQSVGLPRYGRYVDQSTALRLSGFGMTRARRRRKNRGRSRSKVMTARFGPPAAAAYGTISPPQKNQPSPDARRSGLCRSGEARRRESGRGRSRLRGRFFEAEKLKAEPRTSAPGYFPPSPP